jgi:hypothetical protein
LEIEAKQKEEEDKKKKEKKDKIDLLKKEGKWLTKA